MLNQRGRKRRLHYFVSKRTVAVRRHGNLNIYSSPELNFASLYREFMRPAFFSLFLPAICQIRFGALLFNSDVGYIFARVS